MNLSTNGSSSQAARIFGQAGEGARAWGFWHAWLPVAAVVGAIGFVAGSAWRPAVLRDGIAGVALLGLALALPWLLRRGGDRAARHRLGALGEQAVAWRLSLLPAGWSVFHAYPFASSDKGGGRDVDHVVLGPSGCFVVETKNWPGRLELRDGTLRSEGRVFPGAGLSSLSALAARFSDHLRETSGLRVDVVPLLCLAGGRIGETPRQETGVWICVPENLPGLLQDMDRPVLGEAMVARLVQGLSLPYESKKETP